MATKVQVTFDCADPTALAEFWAQAVGYILQPPPPGFDTWEAFGEQIGMPAGQYWIVMADPKGSECCIA